MRIRHAAVFFGAAVTACSLTTSLDGLSGAGVDAGASGDAAADDGVPRAGDGAGDAPTGADAGDAGAFCDRAPPAPTRVFCDDFDEGAASIAQFEAVLVTPAGAGTATLDSTASSSPPSSLLARFDGAPGGGGAALYETFTAAPPEALHVELAVRLNAAAVDVVVVDVGFGATMNRNPAYQIYVNLGASDGQIVEYTARDGGQMYFGHDLLVLPKVGVWSKVAFDVSFVTRKLTATVDGVNALLDTTIQPAAATGTMSLQTGIKFTASSVPVSVNLDDLLVTAGP